MNTKLNSAIEILTGTNISIVDAARFAKNILNAKPTGTKLNDAQFIWKVIEIGLRNFRTKEMNFSDGFALYYKRKSHLRPDSLRDIRSLGNKLIRGNPDLANRNFSEFSISDCESWLIQTFHTPSQFNKGRAMLHALFEFALRHEWCERNPIKLVERKKVIEKEFKPLSLNETKRIITTSQTPKFKNCLPAIALLTYAGIRPREVRRLKWRDIDLNENSITVRSQCSKTGGVRHVEICPALKDFLEQHKSEPDSYLCSKNWQRRWKNIRDSAGFKGQWVQDILRHTYASYHAKHFHDLSRLQLNMGHHDQNLLRSRYINMTNITRAEAKEFFMG